VHDFVVCRPPRHHVTKCLVHANVLRLQELRVQPKLVVDSIRLQLQTRAPVQPQATRYNTTRWRRHTTLARRVVRAADAAKHAIVHAIPLQPRPQSGFLQPSCNVLHAVTAGRRAGVCRVLARVGKVEHKHERKLFGLFAWGIDSDATRYKVIAAGSGPALACSYLGLHVKSIGVAFYGSVTRIYVCHAQSCECNKFSLQQAPAVTHPRRPVPAA